MPYLYPRQRKRLTAINGIFDDFHDSTFSKTNWFETYTGSQLQWDVVAAPGGAGGNALWLKGTINDALSNLDGNTHLSPYPNISKQYYINISKQRKWKMRAEFRLYIVQDQGDGTNQPLSHSAGFILDGAVKWTTGHNARRCGVFFNVANQRVGLAKVINGSCTELTDVAWAGAYNTYYDVRIEWEWDWYYRRIWGRTDWEQNDGVGWTGLANQCMRVNVKVYINNSNVIDGFIYVGDWRADVAPMRPARELCVGRCGVGVNVENDDTGDVSNGSFVEAYFKDIWITMDAKVINWEYEDSILEKGLDRIASGSISSSSPEMVGEGADLQIHCRNSKTADWEGAFRGIIRQPSRISKRIASFEAEGYDSIIASEKTENLSFTAKTAQEIIAGTVNDPETKNIFNVTTYFDSAPATYTRLYTHNAKMGILNEMAHLSNFLLFLDTGNNFNHLKPTNSRLYTDTHFEWGANRIRAYDEQEVFVRQPTKIRVIGSGVYAEKELSAQTFITDTEVLREFIRLDLTTQAEADEALEYYAALYREPLRFLELEVRADWSVTKGKYVRVSIPHLGFNYSLFTVISVKGDSLGGMTLKCIKYRAGLTALLADLSGRMESQEGEAFAQDLIIGADEINIEGVAKAFVSARFQIREYFNGPVYDKDGNELYGQYAIMREGTMIVTDTFMDDLNDFMVAHVPGSFPAPYEFIHLGNGTTPAKEDDTVLDNDVHTEDITTNWEQDGQRTWGNSVSGILEGASFLFRVAQGDYNYASAITEIGLFTTSSPSSKMACRAVFDSYTPDFASTVQIIISLTVDPAEGTCYPGMHFFTQMYFWILDIALDNAPIERFHFVGTNTFTIPSVEMEEESEYGGDVLIVPKNASDVSLTVTQLKDQNMINYEQTYTIDYTNDRQNPATPDQQLSWIAGCHGDLAKNSLIMLFYRTLQTLSDIDGWDTKVILWLKFERGELDTININKLIKPRFYATRDKIYFSPP